MPELPIANGFYRSDSLPLSAQRCVNWKPIVSEAPALNDRSLFATEGIADVTLTGAALTGVNRGSQKMGNVPYFVNGFGLFSMSADGFITYHGVIPDLGRVSMANDGVYLVIVTASGNAHVYDGTTLAPITDPNYRLSSSVVYKDKYFVFTAFDGSIFFNSSLTRPLTFDALDFGSAEINPDKIVVAHVNHNELFIGGLETIELFQNVGGADFPFARIPGANIQKGVHAAHSVIEFDNTFLFAGGGQNEKTAIWKVSSSANAQKISTAAIDAEIQKFSKAEIEASFAMNYASGGNFLAVFTFESETIPSKTFVFDATTSALTEQLIWHERQTGVDENSWCARSIVKAYGELYVGGDSQIGRLDKDIYTEYGDAIYREVASQPFTSGGTPVFVQELQLTMESGVGLATGQGSDPIIRHDYSDDGGRTFSHEMQRSYGRIGDYESLPTWRRLGRVPRHRVLRYKTTEPVQSNILKLEGDFSEGYS